MMGRGRKRAFQGLKDISTAGILNTFHRAVKRKNHGKREMHWCDWKFLCAIKEERGWRLVRNPYSLLAQTLKVKYFRDSDFLNSKLGNLPSLT
ncbi:RNA-directed DNA polymerase reverse transcriptase family protein [Gossypium australe]|uniref:RNA-directed DNA polymerase reverse transcriptase family protein n=1 Tax=Gossypium australe TaxID=47621 RepID=A0A5B6X424_9ROSI|nr:RNA-directed DNA polymerase reverse transcriptase family protein [Gossypium australe]